MKCSLQCNIYVFQIHVTNSSIKNKESNNARLYGNVSCRQSAAPDNICNCNLVNVKLGIRWYLWKRSDVCCNVFYFWLLRWRKSFYLQVSKPDMFALNIEQLWNMTWRDSRKFLTFFHKLHLRQYLLHLGPTRHLHITVTT